MRTACDDKLTPEHLPLMSLLVLLSFTIPTLFAFLFLWWNQAKKEGLLVKNLQ